MTLIVGSSLRGVGGTEVPGTCLCIASTTALVSQHLLLHDCEYVRSSSAVCTVACAY